jgi:CheY-like chemotaxis protein
MSNQNTPFKILLVDDEKNFRHIFDMLLKMTLGEERNNWELLEAGDGDEALQMFYTEKPQIIFTDILHPGLDGQLLVEAMRATNPYIYIGVLSSVEMLAGVRGHNVFLAKPFVIQDFSRVLQMAMNHTRQLLPLIENFPDRKEKFINNAYSLN